MSSDRSREEAEITAVTSGRTLARCFADTVRSRPDAVALRARSGGDWTELTWREYGDRATRVAAALAQLGVGRGTRVALMMRNRPEFHIADVATLLLAGTPFSIYNSSPSEQISYLLGHSEARVAIVEDAVFLERLLAVCADLPALRHIVVLDGAVAGDGTIPFADLLAAPGVDLETAAAVATPDDLAMLVYTSGTTGPPKGAVHSHANVCWVMESFRRSLGASLEGKRVVSYLPMAHVLERDVSHYLHLIDGSEVTCCPDPAAVGGYLRDVRPHFFAAVPRVWEKLAGAIRAIERSPEEEEAFETALAIGMEVATARMRGADLSDELQAAWEQADAAQLAPARALLGLDDCSSAFTGGAPIPPDVHRFFLALGVPLGEGYGLTESTFVFTFEPYRVRVGTVGRPMPGIEARLAADGEVLVRGPLVFQGYLGAPEKTAEAINAGGWLCTGDIGRFDDAGYLAIVDRKKELIITAGGKNISPANLEGALKSHRLIGQACAIGDRRPYLVALLVLDPEAAPAWARAKGISDTSLASLAHHPEVMAELERNVAAVNEGVAQAEQVKRYVVLHDEWLPDSDELTPTMKLKRRGIAARFGAEIEALYAPAEQPAALA